MQKHGPRERSREREREKVKGGVTCTSGWKREIERERNVRGTQATTGNGLDGDGVWVGN